jgi:hypothetical protein
MPPSNVRISSLANGDLKGIKSTLQADFGIKASGEEIASALIHGTSVPQLVGMLSAYNKMVAEADADESPS